ncbi:hypothetical protein FAVG1_02639 [Fusarium avenaceum]|nr:hypothetical protein FAVG1_02639 [Fusarium avenaceum]
MRWSSFATVLGAALLPAASARALCRPDRSTTIAASASAETATTLETLSTDAAIIATSIETSATVEITDASETTIAETQTVTATTDITTVVISSASEAPSTTQAASTTEASTTVSEAPVITEFFMNGNFEDIVNTDWALNAATIQEHSTKARLGRRYVEFTLNNEVADGSKRISQAISGLSTERTYRLSAYAILFSDPVIVKGASDICVIEVAQATPSFEMRLAQWVFNFNNLEQYTQYKVDFSPLSTGVSVVFKLKCTIGSKVTLAAGLDDVSMVDIGPKIVG